MCLACVVSEWVIFYTISCKQSKKKKKINKTKRKGHITTKSKWTDYYAVLFIFICGACCETLWTAGKHRSAQVARTQEGEQRGIRRQMLHPLPIHNVGTRDGLLLGFIRMTACHVKVRGSTRQAGCLVCVCWRNSNIKAHYSNWSGSLGMFIILNLQQVLSTEALLDVLRATCCVNENITYLHTSPEDHLSPDSISTPLFFASLRFVRPIREP